MIFSVFFFRFCRWVFGLSLVKFLSSYYAIMYDVNAFSKKRESRKNLSLFFVQKIFFSILELNIFLARRESENIWRKYENIKLLVCLFWQLFTITFRPRVFEFFAEVSVGCWGNIWRWNIWFFFCILNMFRRWRSRRWRRRNRLRWRYEFRRLDLEFLFLCVFVFEE